MKQSINIHKKNGYRNMKDFIKLFKIGGRYMMRRKNLLSSAAYFSFLKLNDLGLHPFGISGQ